MPSPDKALARLLSDYHLCTEAGKGEAVADVEALPERLSRDDGRLHLLG